MNVYELGAKFGVRGCMDQCQHRYACSSAVAEVQAVCLWLLCMSSRKDILRICTHGLSMMTKFGKLIEVEQKLGYMHTAFSLLCKMCYRPTTHKGFKGLLYTRIPRVYPYLLVESGGISRVSAFLSKPHMRCSDLRRDINWITAETDDSNYRYL
jgi:hypothetical protein